MTYTPGDRTLVNQIITKLSTHLAEGEKVLADKKAAAAKAAAAEAAEAADAYQGQDDTNSGNDEELPPHMRPGFDPGAPTEPAPGFVDHEDGRRPDPNYRWPEGPHGIKLPALLGRRRGNTMALGAMQAHDRFNNMTADRGLTPYQRKSYLAAEREMTLAKARAGAQVDVNQQLKDAPVTRPWSMQVTVPTQQLEQLHLQLDQSLASIGLNQSMFTQQTHNYIAQILNSLDSSMNPSDRTEFVVEKIMSEMVNRSALLKDNVRVDVRQNGWPPVNIAPADTTSVDSLGSAFLKTKAAMGRLLG
jgi:hypothetical protein